MERARNFKDRLETLLTESRLLLETNSLCTKSIFVAGNNTNHFFHELLVGLEGVLCLHQVGEQEVGEMVDCEALVHRLTEDSSLLSLSITVGSRLPEVFINGIRLRETLRWLFRGALRNGHKTADISHQDNALIISCHSENSPSSPLEDLLEYHIANEIFSFSEQTLLWEDNGQSAKFTLSFLSDSSR